MQQSKAHWQAELIWWLFTVVLCALVLLPIYSNGIKFPFYVYNIIYIIAAITLTRYLFFLTFSWLRDRFIAQAAVIFLLIPLIFIMVQGMNEYITYLDNNGPDVLVRHLGLATQDGLNTYLKSEYFFFGVWAVVAGGLLPFRIIVNVWRRYLKQKNRA